MRVRMKNRYTPKKWFKRWMFWAAVYPFHFACNLAALHRYTAEDVRDDIYEWGFPTPPTGRGNRE